MRFTTRRVVAALFIACALGVTVPASAQSVAKIPVYLEVMAPDTVGTTYVYQLREQLRASHAYLLVGTRAEASYHVWIATLDPYRAEPGRANSMTVASVVMAYGAGDLDYYLQHWVLSVGRDGVAGSVSDLVAAIDKEVQTLETMRHQPSSGVTP